MSIWEEDFSQVTAAIDDLKAQGVRDFSQYIAAHPEFIQQAISMVKIIDVNDATVKLFEAQSKDELLVSLHKIFLPEAEEVFAGELIAINQPLAAIITNGNACLRWLAGDSPNLDEARETARRIIRDGNRAGDVIGRIRTLLRKTGTEKELLDMNQAVREVVALAEGEVRRNGVALRTELTGDLPPILGDRVELEQVVLNLIMNAIEAMSAIGDRPRELVVRTQSGEVDQVCVTVQDSGIGLDPQSMGRIFDAFYTTKSQGMGMGLAISRSIVENHGGQLWAVPNEGPGATFQFTLQACSKQE